MADYFCWDSDILVTKDRYADNIKFLVDRHDRGNWLLIYWGGYRNKCWLWIHWWM